MPSDPFTWIGFLRRQSYLGLVLVLALINGLVFIKLVPPWQHYDEPGHLEYAWLIVDRMRVPKEGEYNQKMRREMAASMIEYDFFKNLDLRPNLLSQTEPIWIGPSQTRGLPLYYFLIALPLKLVQYTDITFQLCVGRAISLCLYLITVIAAYGIVRDITPNHHPLRWMVPLTLTLLPGFVDLMTAVNDDVGATAAFSMFLWAGVRIIQRGYSWQRIVALGVTTIACALTKNTVVIALILFVMPLLFVQFRKSRHRIYWTGIPIVGLFLLIALVRFGDAAYWHRDTRQRQSTNTPRADAPVGKSALQLNSSAGIFQMIPQSDLNELRGKTITVGAWIWADQPVHASLPILEYDGQKIKQMEAITRKPIFHAYNTTLPEDLTRLIVSIAPETSLEDGNRIYYDGIILASGDHSQDGVPSAQNSNATWLDWKSRSVRNYIRNASGEKSWVVFRSTVDRLLASYVPGRPDLYFSMLQDWRSVKWYYQVTLDNLLKTFWGKFGWGHIPYTVPGAYPVLAIFSITGMIAAAISLYRHRRALSIYAVAFLIISGTIIWLFTILRGLNSVMGSLFVPSSRYAFPAIVPTVLILNVGWLEISSWLKGKFGSRLLMIILLLSAICLNILAIYTITRFYYGG